MIISFLIKKMGGYNCLREKYVNSRSSRKRYIYTYLNRIYNYESNSYLPFNATIKGKINFPHGISGIYISGDATIGNNCTIYQQVTIGSNMLIDSKGLGSPTIGDNVLIGAGAKIIGKVKIGNNCRIGANAVVTKDIPAHSVVVSGNLVIIEKENLENRVYQKHSEGWGYLENGNFIVESNHDKINILHKLN